MMVPSWVKTTRGSRLPRCKRGGSPHTRSWRISSCLVVLAVLLAVGCSRQKTEEQPSAAPATETPTVSVSTPVPTTGAEAAPSKVPTAIAAPRPEPAGAVLADGRHFGFIKRVDTSAPSLVFDLAYYLTGPAADKAAQEAGVVGPGAEVENDYFIQNDNPRLRTLPVAREVEIEVLEQVGDPETSSKVSLDTFASYFRASGDPHADSGHWVTMRDGKVRRVEQQYSP